MCVTRSVHFSVGTLEPAECKFSPSNFSRYYTMFGRIYGAYMFCVYFELFARFLRPGNEEKKIVNDIRKLILTHPRWPEIITFEEMNVKPPEIDFAQIAVAAIQAQLKTKLLSSNTVRA